MAFTSGTGAKIFIGPVNSTANTASAYAALTYTEIGEVDSMSEFGPQSSVITFASLGDAIMRKAKGVRDNGDATIVVANDPRDPGQIALVAAEKTNFQYAVKVLAADAPDANDTDSVWYWRALVGSARLQGLSSNDVTKRGFQLFITSLIVEVPSQAVSGP